MDLRIPMKYKLCLKKSIWLLKGALTDTSTLDQSGPGGNGNAGVLDISKSPKTKALPI